jgi:hypothetical protein
MARAARSGLDARAVSGRRSSPARICVQDDQRALRCAGCRWSPAPSLHVPAFRTRRPSAGACPASRSPPQPNHTPQLAPPRSRASGLQGLQGLFQRVGGVGIVHQPPAEALGLRTSLLHATGHRAAGAVQARSRIKPATPRGLRSRGQHAQQVGARCSARPVAGLQGGLRRAVCTLDRTLTHGQAHAAGRDAQIGGNVNRVGNRAGQRARCPRSTGPATAWADNSECQRGTPAPDRPH